MARKPDAPVQLKLRFTEALRRRLEYAAQENTRSMNTEVIHRLTQSFERDAAEKERGAWLAKLMGHILDAADGKCSAEEALKRITTHVTSKPEQRDSVS
jgi:Arc-like DNA binding dprotein